MKGELLTYPNPKEVGIGPLPMFLSGDINSSNAIVFVAGLTNTLDSVPYVRPLSEALEKEGWCFVQLLTSSSGYGFAHGSLDRDTSEMSSAVSTLRKMGKSKIVIMGHSTGSQDVIHYVNGNYERVDGVIAQAPVSDREAIDDNISKWIPTAIKMIEEGKKDEAMPRESITWFDTPITAYRYWSLFSEGGDDDYFTSTLPSDVFEKNYTNVKNVPLALIFSGSDEFVPSSVKKEELAKRMQDASKGNVKLSVVIPDAKHDYKGGMEGTKPTLKLIENVKSFIKQYC